MHTDEIMRLAETIKRLASDEYPDHDTMKMIWKSAKQIMDVRGAELEEADFAAELAGQPSAAYEDHMATFGRAQ
jgi:hypothetical protein